MEDLIRFGFALFNSVSPIVEFLGNPISVPFISSWGLIPTVTLVTLTPAQLIVGSGLVALLVIKIYKFILDLIPFA